MTARRFKAVSPIIAAVLTLVIFALIFRRVPLDRLADALRQADYRVFLALMIPNTLFYFAWDTLVLSVVIRWFMRRSLIASSCRFVPRRTLWATSIRISAGARWRPTCRAVCTRHSSSWAAPSSFWC
jgi:hypothetical protein